MSSNSIMNGLLQRVTLLGVLGVCVPAQELLDPPARVRFDSLDYKNVLHWTPASNSSNLSFYVQWKIYGEAEWLDVSGCQGIPQHHCDLSRVTSEPTEWYYARVHASSPSSSSKSAWRLSPRFSPRWDTIISPPSLRLNFTEEGVVIRLKPPRVLVRKMHKKLLYKIYVIHTSGEEVHELNYNSHTLTLTHLLHKSKYCLQAQTTIPLQAKTSSRSQEKCGTTH